VLPFKRFRTADGHTVDSVLGPEMRSTGEVMGIDRDFPTAFAKSQAAAYGGLPTSGTVFLSVADDDKRAVILPAHRLQELGFRSRRRRAPPRSSRATASGRRREQVPETQESGSATSSTSSTRARSTSS
jgi:hypothetical protein